MLKVLISIGLASAWLVPAAATAQDAADYPNKPVRIIVTVPAGRRGRSCHADRGRGASQEVWTAVHR